MAIKGPKGTHDIIFNEINKWHIVESKLTELMQLYDYNEIRTPIFESTELFLRGVGDTTDIVDKEMYTFLDKGNRSITLRPEGTASVARAFIEHSGFNEVLPSKFYYIGPMFRYSRPQTGRYRQFHQFGIEVIGSINPYLDGEILELMMNIFISLGIKNLKLEINSVGCPSCRPLHKEKLKNYLKKNYSDLCPTCQGRYEKNPLRIFDCKNLQCQEIINNGPLITDNLCEECDDHFKKVKYYLEMTNVEYLINKKMVRGLDYYTKTAFEITAGKEGAQSSLGGGGRYDGLIEELGGPNLPGIGFAIGLERVVLTMEEQGLFDKLDNKHDKVYVANVSENNINTTIKLVQELRKNGVVAINDIMSRKLKNQFKYANKINADYVIIIGDDEIVNHIYPLKNMNTGEQIYCSLDELIKILRGV